MNELVGNRAPRDRYNSDPHFRALVDTMLAHIFKCDFTPSEMREASILASIIYEEKTIRDRLVYPMDDSIADALRTLERWRG